MCRQIRRRHGGNPDRNPLQTDYPEQTNVLAHVARTRNRCQVYDSPRSSAKRHPYFGLLNYRTKFETYAGICGAEWPVKTRWGSWTVFSPRAGRHETKARRIRTLIY